MSSSIIIKVGSGNFLANSIGPYPKPNPRKIAVSFFSESKPFTRLSASFSGLYFECSKRFFLFALRLPFFAVSNSISFENLTSSEFESSGKRLLNKE